MSVAFVPLNTFMDAAFWNEINKRKLNDWRLDESPRDIMGFLSIYDAEGTDSRLSLSHESFLGDESDASSVAVRGRVLLTNTLETFQKLDRKLLIQCEAQRLWSAIVSEEWLSDPSVLNTFLFTVFADLKKFHYYFWNCVPALCAPAALRVVDAAVAIGGEESSSLLALYKQCGQSVFLVDGSGAAHPLSKLREMHSVSDVRVVLADPSTAPAHLGWPWRNVLAALARFRPDWVKQGVRLVSLRAGQRSYGVTVAGEPWTSDEPPPVVGWERDAADRLKPSSVDMRAQFDPKKLMEQSVGLNLSLIKWRLVPELRLERMANLKVLMLGAGTLGCNLARALMGWGVTRFTFVDNSNVSYSNPVRQSLSEFEDARESRGKADVAAAALTRIYPSVRAEAVRMTVPMPGHAVGDSGESELLSSVARLDELIAGHDVVFLALDSREARWLPTVIASERGKMAYSVALGFDTFVVIRHGVGGAEEGEGEEKDVPTSLSSPVPYAQLACYFCSDVTAPGNSTHDRTLDQQCTVSRPGLSMVASGCAVELLASVLQVSDPLSSRALIGEQDDSASLLGATPHQIRGFIGRFQQLTPCVRRFDRCVACGPNVRAEWRERGGQFVKDVCNSPSLLEKVAGLEDLQMSAENVNIDFDDDDDSVVSM